MAAKQPGPRYLKTMVETATPVGNIIALYEKSLFHLRNARESLSAGDIARKAESLRKAMDILFYLDNTLGSVQSEATHALHDSYRMLLAQLSLANSENSLKLLELAEKWLAGLLEAWQGTAPAETKQDPTGQSP